MLKQILYKYMILSTKTTTKFANKQKRENYSKFEKGKEIIVIEEDDEEDSVMKEKKK